MLRRRECLNRKALLLAIMKKREREREINMKAARYIDRTAIITMWLYYGMIPKQLVVLSVGFIPNIEYLTVNH